MYVKPLPAALCALFALRCAAAASQSTHADPVVAELDGAPVHQSEVDKSANTELTRIDREANKQRYEARKQALDAMLFRMLVQIRAKAAGVESDAYVEQELQKRVKPVTKEDAAAFFEKNKDRVGGAELAELEDKIVEFLTTQRRSEAIVALYGELKAATKLRLLLPRPESERKQVASDGPSIGDQAAKVVIVTFSDFQCPFCARARETAAKVLAAYPGRVRLVFHQFPLPSHENAFKAAEASLCAHDQGKFWALHDHMFAHQEALDIKAIEQGARDVGLDGAAFDKCLEDGKHASDVTQSIAQGKLLGVEGTPAFFINGIELHGAQPFERFVEIIEAELAPK